MPRFFSFPVFRCLQPPVTSRPRISGPLPAPATTSEIRQFFTVLRHGKPQAESAKPSQPPLLMQSEILPPRLPPVPHPALPQPALPPLAVFLPPAQPPLQQKNTPSEHGTIPGKKDKEQQPQTHKLISSREDIPEKENTGKKTVAEVPPEPPSDNIPRISTEKITAHLETRRADIITRISDTLAAHITSISRHTETLTACRAAFPALGEISFTIRHRPEGIQIQICCPPGGAAFLQSCLPQLQERLMQKIPQAITLSLTGSDSAMRRK